MVGLTRPCFSGDHPKAMGATLQAHALDGWPLAAVLNAMPTPIPLIARRLAMCALLGGLTHGWAHAQDLAVGAPDRSAVIALARASDSMAAPSQAAGTGWSIRRVWSADGLAVVCAVAVNRQGHVALDAQGQLLMSRVHLSRSAAGWRVTEQDQMPLQASANVRQHCQPRASEATMLAALQELSAAPPTAGPSLSTSRPNECPPPPSTDAQADGTPGRVSARGRSLLHNAPDLACRMGKHLVQGDKVLIEAQRPGWARVRYTHPITQVVTVGWIRSPRVAQTSTSTSLP